MVSEYGTKWSGIQMARLHDFHKYVAVLAFLFMYNHLKSGLDFKWVNHLNIGHLKVQYSEESGVHVFGYIKSSGPNCLRQTSIALTDCCKNYFVFLKVELLLWVVQEKLRCSKMYSYELEPVPSGPFSLLHIKKKLTAPLKGPSQMTSF